MTQLSEHFTLQEFLRSDTAKRLNITEQQSPSNQVVVNLAYLCEKVLEPIRKKFGPIRISSGYRCPRLNAAVNGRSTSLHLFGCAADIDFGTRERNLELFAWIKEKAPGFTELINEYDFDWVHVGIVKGREREKTIKVVK